MDFIKNLASQQGQHNAQAGQQPQQQSGGGGFMGMLNNAAGGGQSGEAKEGTWAFYGLDKAIDYVQEHYLGAGKSLTLVKYSTYANARLIGQQSNESALEQAKDEQISDTIRQQYKNMTGKDFPIADK